MKILENIKILVSHRGKEITAKLNEIQTLMGSLNEPITGEPILEKLVKNKKDGTGKKKFQIQKIFLNMI